MKSRSILLACATALAWAAPSPAAQPSTDPTAYLRSQCVLHAADPKNPWALAHGVTGVGKSHTAADGRLAHEVMVSDFVLTSEVDGAGRYAFAAYAADRTPIEPHPNLLTKTLVLAKLPTKQSWKTPSGKQVSLSELIASAQTSFRHVPQAPGYWHDVGWTLDLFGHVLTPKRAKFENGAKETVDFNAVMDDALTALEQLHSEIATGMDAGEPLVPKRKQGIYAHSCGGLHLVQAVFTWARFPEVRKRWGKRLDRQIDVLFYRLESERRQYDAALAGAPHYKLQVLVQQMKFYGHFLETTGRLEQEKVVKLDAAKKQKVLRARALLHATVSELQSLQAYETIETLRASQPQVALDLIGDGCHAANGLSLTAVKKK